MPLLVRWPGVAKPGAVRDEPSVALDVTATSLAAAGIAVPANFHGRPLFGPRTAPRGFVVTARDRCDMTVDHIRAVRDRRYRYIRNFANERPYAQYNRYIQTSYPTLAVLKELHAAGKLNAVQERFMAARKPPVEFYDCQADPHQVRNLADDPAEKGRVAQFAARLDAWRKDTRDQGGSPESPDELEQANAAR